MIHKLMIMVLAAVLISASELQAATISSVVDGGYNGGATWSDGNVPANGNDYVVTNIVSVTTSSDVTLAGDSLTVNPGGEFHHDLTTGTLKSLTTPPFTLNGGSMRLARISSQYTFKLNFQSSIYISNDSTLTIGTGVPNYDCTVNLNGALTGSGNIDLVGNVGNDTGDWVLLSLKNSNNTFSGNWNIHSIDTGCMALYAAAEGALGSGDITLGTRSILALTYAWSNSAATLTMATSAELDLVDSDSYIAYMTVGGLGVQPGTYTAGELTSLGFGGTFSGTGSITVMAAWGGTITSVAGSSNNGGWNEAAVWSDGNVPVITNNYVIDGETVTCANQAGSTFSGGSLTVSSGILRMYGNSSSQTATVGNVTFAGGQLLCDLSNWTSTFDWQSSINFEEGTTNSIKLLGGIYECELNLNGALTGSGIVNVITDRNDTGDSRSCVIANHADSTFSGNWTVTGYDSGAVGYLNANAANALGTGIVTLKSRGALNVTGANGIDSLSNITMDESTSLLKLTYAWSNSTATLTMTDGTLDLVSSTNYIHRLHIDGHNVATGSYTAAELTALGYGGNFTGTGELNILYDPEGTLITIR